MTREQKIIEKYKEVMGVMNNTIIALQPLIKHNRDKSLVAKLYEYGGQVELLANQVYALESEPTAEMFEKVYIKSEADLPTEKERYICHRLNFGMDSIGWEKGCSTLWMKNIDWYLRPIKH